MSKNMIKFPLFCVCSFFCAFLFLLLPIYIILKLLKHIYTLTHTIRIWILMIAGHICVARVF